MNLPFDKNLSISKLSSVFRSTSATYKFYWFLSIIESLETGKSEISKKELFSRMLSLSWYTLNYFKVSFGKQDLIEKAIEEVKNIENIPIDAKQSLITSCLSNSKNSKTIKALDHFDLNVPHKFLSPWLGSGTKKDVYEASQSFQDNCPYALYKEKISVSDVWKNYLVKNAGILKAFIYWNLSLFLQARNPNVPNIPNKLIKPAVRKALTKHKNNYWNIVINEIGGIDCIYTGKRLYENKYAVEHFLPYQYLTHDLMWNLIPADSSFNSSKSDKLPPLNIYFDKFYNIQSIGFEIIKEKQRKNKFLEHYLSIFPDLKMEKEVFLNHLNPLFTIAYNNGFNFL